MKELIRDIEKLSEATKPINILEEKELIKEIASEVKVYLEKHEDVVSIAANQLGYENRIFGINFNGTIKIFVNPIITEKRKPQAIIEKLVGFDNKEYLVIRPTEIKAVYYTEDFKYEDNKFTEMAAALFDQQVQLLEGTLPAEIGLESDITTDGKLEDLTEEEFKEAVEMLRKITEVRLKAQTDIINENEALQKQYTSLRFSESVIDGTTTVVQEQPKYNRETRRAMAKAARRKK